MSRHFPQENVSSDLSNSSLYLVDDLLKDKPESDLSTNVGLINALVRNTRKSTSLGERYSLFPIQDDTMYKAFKIQEAALWSSNEMDFSRDKKDYQELSVGLKRIIDYVNAFFSATDGVIIENILNRFLLEASTLEEKCFY